MISLLFLFMLQSFVGISGLLNVINAVRHEVAIRTLFSKLEKDESSISSTAARVENMISTGDFLVSISLHFYIISEITLLIPNQT